MDNNNRISMSDALKEVLATKLSNEDKARLGRGIVCIFSVVAAISATVFIIGLVK